MHNRALHDSLAAFVQEAAWQLAEEVAGRRRDPVRARRDADAQRPAVLLSPADRAASSRSASAMLVAAADLSGGGAGGSPRCPTCPPTCSRRGRRVPAGDAHARRRALQAFLGAVWADATDFVFDDRALRGRLPRARGGRLRRLRAVGRDHARRGARDRVRRGARSATGSRWCARRRSPTRPPGSPTTRTPTVAVLALETARATAARSRPPAAACAACRPRCACGTTPSRRSARPPGRAPTAARWMAIPLATGLRRPAERLPAEPPRRRTRCARSAASSSRRTPRAGELAWALRRFELGCERGGAVEALTDWLLAARALFADVDSPATTASPSGSPRSAPRPHDRPRLEHRVREAISLERAAMAGFVRPGARGRRARRRARRLPARGPARRAVRAPRSRAAPGRGRIARKYRSPGRLKPQSEQV